MTERIDRIIDWLWKHQVKAFVFVFYVTMMITMMESCD